MNVTAVCILLDMVLGDKGSCMCLPVFQAQPDRRQGQRVVGSCATHLNFLDISYLDPDSEPCGIQCATPSQDTGKKVQLEETKHSSTSILVTARYPQECP